MWRKSRTFAAMKQYIHIAYVWLIALVLVGCDGRKPMPDVLARADSLMEEHSDSALALLRGAEGTDTWTRHDQMLLALLRSRAEDKNHVNRTNDSTMLLVAEYFNRRADARLRALAWFELGRISSDMELTGQAISAYRRAFDTDTLSADSGLVDIRAMAADWMGHTLMYQDLYGEAMPHFHEAHRLARQCGDAWTETFVLRDIARCHVAQGNPAEGEDYFLRASRKAMSQGDTTLFREIQMELSDLYASAGAYAEMRACLDACMGYVGRDSGIVYNQLADYYLATGRADSATALLRRVIRDDNPYVRRSATLSLADLKAGEGDFRVAYDLLAKSIAEDDSLTAVEQGQNADLIRTLTDKIDREKEQDRQLRQRTSVIYGLALVLVFVALFTYFTIRHKNLQNRIQREKAERLIAELRKAGRTERPQRERGIRAFTESDVYTRFHDPNFTPTLSDYHVLEDALNATYDDCTRKIRDLHDGIKDKEMRLCLLEKAEVPNKLICYHLGMEPNALSMLRARLYAKLFKQKGSAEKFHEFIKTL